jgi:hypothetical protein
MPTVKYPGLIEFVKNNLTKGKQVKDIYRDAVRKFGYDEEFYLFNNYCYKVKMRHMEDDSEVKVDSGDAMETKLLKLLKKHAILGGAELCELLECTPKDLFKCISNLRKEGHEIICDDTKIIMSTDVAPMVEPLKKPIENTEIIFGVASDLHFGSKACQITALNEFAEICRRKGVKHMFTPGDIFAGYRVYKGQEFEVYATTAKEQEESVAVNLPEGFDWYMLGGNHDYSFFKNSGHNPLVAVSRMRNDIHYVGFDEADVPILKDVDLRMWHPSGGVPYSISYRLQKGVEQIAYAELAQLSMNLKDRPTIRFLLCGHLHIQMQAMFGSIFGMQAGCFEGQTQYLKRHGLHPQVGGWIVKAEMKRGEILNFNAHFYRFPFMIPDDYKNYKHTITPKEIEKPIFEK